MTRLSLNVLNEMPTIGFVAALGGIFEHSPWVAEAVAGQRPFGTLAALHEAMKVAVQCVDDERKLALLRAHPDLAGKAALAGSMTDDSKFEQGSAGLDRLSKPELQRFHALNSAYMNKFGFPFIICVRRHSKDSIFHQFETRLMNDAAGECVAALSEIFRITALRLDQHVEARDRLKVHGFMDVHVIDVDRGMPAVGLSVQLWELPKSSEAQHLATDMINAKGLTDRPFFEGRPIPIGQYELRFALRSYFAGRSERLSIPFFDVVPVRFSVAEPEGHYHIPLRITPWIYSVYRGQ
jgi:2-oxo-4-hydroxy-4-carboxy-5-ureidoimidazoline decarboxylase